MSRLTLFAAALAIVGASGAATGVRADAVEGMWLTDDHKGVVRIAACGAQLCGTIVKVLDQSPGTPKTDVNNPDPRARSQPLVGLRTLWGFKPGGQSWSGGHVYDPKSGKSYRSTLALERDGELKVTGCVLFICDSRYWTRYR